MGSIATTIAIAFAIYFFGKRIPEFKNFNIKYGGVVLFLLAIWGLANFESALDGARRRPSFAPFVIIAAYGFLYRIDLFKLVGLRRAYPEEEQGWKFTATLSTAILLPSVYFSINNLLIFSPVAILIWFIIFFATIEAQKEKNLPYFSASKLGVPIVFLIISIGIYWWFVK